MKRYMIGILLSAVFILSCGFVMSIPSMISARYTCNFVEKSVGNMTLDTLEKFNLKDKLESKYQGVWGPCWAFASIATLEVTLAKKNMLNKPLSEKSLLNWVNRRDNESGWHTKLRDGGNFSMSTGYFASGEGPFFESSCRYNTNDCNYKDPNGIPVFSVRGIKVVDINTDSIKKAVSEYGAVAISYRSDSDSDSGHAVCIVGWDDNKSSWLVKDSGSNSGNYKWLSYSMGFMDAFAITSVKNTDQNEKIYQYDKFGINSHFSENNDLTCANVYSFNNDTLSSVMIYSESENAKCDIFVSDVDLNGNIKDQSTWICAKGNMTIPYKGYFEIPTKPINLSGEKAIIIKIKGSGNKKADIGLMASNLNGLKINTAEKNNMKSYVFNYGKFVSVRDLKEDVCACSIKAITKK